MVDLLFEVGPVEGDSHSCGHATAKKMKNPPAAELRDGCGL